MTAPHDRDPDRDPQDDRDDDAVFRQIVAGFGDDPGDAVPRWPVSEDLDSDADDPGTAGEQAQLSPYRTGSQRDEGLPGWVEPEALPDDGHYEPPPPPRLPRVRLRTLGALLLVLAGFGVLFGQYPDDTSGSMVLGMLLVAGGVTLLVKGMRDAPGADDRPDDGAVV